MLRSYQPRGFRVPTKHLHAMLAKAEADRVERVTS